MLTETGRVVAVEPDGLWVETIRRSTCGSCTANKGCGHGLLNQIGDGRRNLVRVLLGDEDAGDYRVDQSVRIAIPEAVLLRSSLVVYAVPLLGMLAGAVLAPQIMNQPQDLAAIGGAVMGLLGGIGFVRLHARRHQDDPELQPTLLGPALPLAGESAQLQIQG